MLENSLGSWDLEGGTTFAHELGHNEGLLHVLCAGTELQVDGRYPYPFVSSPEDCKLSEGDNDPPFFLRGHDGYHAVDVYHDLWGLAEPVILSSDAEPPEEPAAPLDSRAFPLMGYHGKRWISPFSYCILLDAQGIACDPLAISMEAGPEPSHPATLAANGALRAQAHSGLRAGAMADIYPGGPPPPPSPPPVNPVLPPGYVVPAVDAGAVAYLLVDGVLDPVAFSVDRYSLEKLDEVPSASALSASQASRAELAALSSTELADLTGVLVLNQYSESPHSLLRADIIVPNVGFVGQPWGFIELVEFAPGAETFELHYGTQILEVTQPSANPPIVSFQPYGYSALTPETEMQWVASDADGDELSFEVFYSVDAGATWMLVGSFESDETSFAVPESLDAFAETSTGLFRVLAFDGFYTSAADLASTVTVPNSPPLVQIGQPDGRFIEAGETLYLDGFATDREDGPLHSAVTPPSQLTWTSTLDGFLGNGSEISTRTLSVGFHTITYQAEDSGGAVRSDSVGVCVGLTEEDLCEDKVDTSVLVGNRDDFFGSTEVLSPSQHALNWFAVNVSAPIVDLDDASINAVRIHTFADLSDADAIILRFKARPVGSATNDNVSLEFFDASGRDPVNRWARRFGDDGSVEGLVPMAWSSANFPDGHEFTLDVSALPLAGGGTQNLLPEIRQRGFVDLYVQDDTMLDYLELIVSDYRPRGVYHRQLGQAALFGGVVARPRPGFADALANETLNYTNHGGVPRNIDVFYPTGGGGHTFGHSFENLSQNEVNAVVALEIGLVADGQTSGDDTISLQYTGTPPGGGPTPLTGSDFAWSAPLAGLNGLPAIWDNGASGVLVLDLTSLPNGGADLASVIEEDGHLDVFVSDDTGVDYIRLTSSHDSDADGLLDIDEYLLGIDPHDPDTDGDGIPDGLDPNPATPDPTVVPLNILFTAPILIACLLWTGARRARR